MVSTSLVPSRPLSCSQSVEMSGGSHSHVASRTGRELMAKIDCISESSSPPAHHYTSELLSSFSDSIPHSKHQGNAISSAGERRKDKEKDSEGEKGISKSVTTFFKTLFSTRKHDSHDAVDAVTKSFASNPVVASPQKSFTATVVTSRASSTVARSKYSSSKQHAPAFAGSPISSRPCTSSSSSHSSPTDNDAHAALRPPVAFKKTSAPMPPVPPPQSPSQLSSSRSSPHIREVKRSDNSVTGAKPSVKLLSVATNLPANMARSSWCVKDYAIIEKMYTGYASTVYKAWCKSSGETVCLKAYNLANLCELNRYQIYREVRLHSSLQHENVIRLFAAFQEADQVVLVQEFAESGDLFLLLHRYGGKLPEKTAVEMILYPFLKVLTYLHQNGVAHRDIKPENVLFTKSMQLKICDFGLAISLREERAVTRAGTLEYMAPEVLNCPFKNKPEENKEKENLYYSMTVDSWAMGVLTYELLVGFPPFNDKQRAAIEEKIRFDQPRFPSSMSEASRSFVLRALQKDPVERPTAAELLNHTWIRAYRRGGGGTGQPANRSIGAAATAAAAAKQTAGSNRPSGIPPHSLTTARPLAYSPRTILASVPAVGHAHSVTLGGYRLPPSVPEGEGVCPDSPLFSLGDSPMKTLDKLCKPSVEMRTLEGDLIRAPPAYLSFTAGAVKSKLTALPR